MGLTWEKAIQAIQAIQATAVMTLIPLRNLRGQVHSDNSTDIAEYYAAQALRLSIQARRNAANAVYAARAAARAARLAKNAATSVRRRPQGGGQRRKCTRHRK